MEYTGKSKKIVAQGLCKIIKFWPEVFDKASSVNRAQVYTPHVHV